MNTRRTCDQLGVCQARTDCAHCPGGPVTTPFSPGILDGPHQQSAKPWAWRLVAALAVITLAGLALGYTLGGGALP